MSSAALKHQDVSGNALREDLLDIITDLSPTETPLFTGLQKSKAYQTVHEWNNITTGRSSSVSAAVEGGDVAFSKLSTPTRSRNYVQEITEAYKVSTKTQDSTLAGMPDPFAFYRARAMKIWKMKAEYALIWGTGNSGISGTAWEMTGLKKAISTNFYSAPSGATLSEKVFNDVLQLAYADVVDDTFECYTSIGLKRNISAFTAGSTKYTDNTDRRLVNAVDVYESDVAKMVKLFGHRDIPTPTTSTAFFMAIQPKAFGVAMLHNPEEFEYPASGPYKAGYIYGSLTLEYRQETAGVIGTNFLIS